MGQIVSAQTQLPFSFHASARVGTLYQPGSTAQALTSTVLNTPLLLCVSMVPQQCLKLTAGVGAGQASDHPWL